MCYSPILSLCGVIYNFNIKKEKISATKLLCEMNEMMTTTIATASTTTASTTKKIQPADFSKYLFWEMNVSTLDMDKHAAWIVERVLDYGSWSDVKLIRDYYGMEKLREIAMGIRSMHPESLSFIATVTHTPENQFRCYELLQSKDTYWYF
ncbi:hypothetical protein SAMD00024442_5_7 [Candidatus Symbiothrix dinenymphae]|nr:hypothetical protein SAMD00024442_5_7 [Candidatus Symbiothrix dinenymphae]